MLDDFSAVKIDSKKPEIPAVGPGRPSTATAPLATDPETTEEDILSDEDFTKQLQAGMAELMGDMNSVP